MLKRLFQILGGFIAGFIGVTFGIGSGIIMIPTLLHTGTKTKKAVGTSIAIMMFISLSGTLQHFVKRTFQPTQENLMFLLAGVVGALICAIFLKSSKSKIVTCLIIAYFIIMGADLIINPMFIQMDLLYQIPQEAFWLSGILIAIIATILGIGAGAILIPLMLYLFDMPVKEIIGLLMPFIFFMSFTVTAVNVKNKLVDFKAFAFLMPSALVGTYVSYLVFDRITNTYLQIGIGGFMIINALIITIRMITTRRS